MSDKINVTALLVAAAAAPATVPAVTAKQREAWLVKATRRITKKWAKLGVTVPKDVQLSCGFPGGGSPHRRIGECWPRSRSADKVNQIFINPTIGSGERALDVLGHELLHSVDDCVSGHGHVFSRNSTKVGYSGGKHSAATHVCALKLIKQLLKQLGEYPNGALALNPKKLKTNAGLHKFECADCNEDVLYSTEANTEKHGTPTCRCCGSDMVPAKRKAKKVITTI